MEPASKPGSSALREIAGKTLVGTVMLAPKEESAARLDVLKIRSGPE
jgi:hypothetical protein